MKKTFLGLGGNIGDTCSILQKALSLIKNLPKVSSFQASKFYRTSPVSDIPQADFVNAACCIDTGLPLKKLFWELQFIEKKLGKRKKAKNAARIIDIDILLYGLDAYNDAELSIPHPKWKERLFVLRPMSDIVEKVLIPCPKNPKNSLPFSLVDALNSFSNPNRETVSELSFQTMISCL